VRAAGRLDAATLPPPLAFEAQVVGGEEMLVATLPDVGGDADGAPFFLTRAEHADLLRFVEDRCSEAPQMLMLTGTIKSGKSRLLGTVLPGLLAHRFAADPRSRRPVVFLHRFQLPAAADESAGHLVGRLRFFAEAVGLQLPPPPNALHSFPDMMLLVARHVRASGGELWFLFDELQAPLLASTPSAAAAFIDQLKAAVEVCSPLARVVGTGSGMVSLLAAVRDAPPNGFALWDAVSHVGLGREPPAPVALAMAERILAGRARARAAGPPILRRFSRRSVPATSSLAARTASSRALGRHSSRTLRMPPEMRGAATLQTWCCTLRLSQCCGRSRTRL